VTTLTKIGSDSSSKKKKKKKDQGRKWFKRELKERIERRTMVIIA
jgi:hypothetical protein